MQKTFLYGTFRIISVVPMNHIFYIFPNLSKINIFFQDSFGFNLAGLKFMKRQFEEKEEVMFFTDASDRQREKRKRKKQRAVLSFKT